MSASVSVTFDADNAAFVDEDDGWWSNEVIHVLRHVARDIAGYRIREGESLSGTVRDTYGNRIGEWTVSR